MKSTEEIIKDVAFASSMITEHLFAEVKDHVNNGCIATYEFIGKLAIEFVHEHLHIDDTNEEWGDYVTNLGFSDYEEYMIDWVNNKLKNQTT